MGGPDPAEWLEKWAVAFATTQLIEAPFYAWAQRGQKRGLLARAGVALLPSAVTHPLLWLGLFLWLYHLGSPSRVTWWSVIAVAELLIVLVEAAILRAAGARRPLLFAALANGASFGFGLLLQALR